MRPLHFSKWRKFKKMGKNSRNELVQGDNQDRRSATWVWTSLWDTIRLHWIIEANWVIGDVFILFCQRLHSFAAVRLQFLWGQIMIASSKGQNFEILTSIAVKSRESASLSWRSPSDNHRKPHCDSVGWMVWDFQPFSPNFNSSNLRERETYDDYLKVSDEGIESLTAKSD
jgi:hypothetical protein